MRPATRSAFPSAVVALAFLVSGCPSTFQYRAIQSQFMDAARADNAASVDPVAGSTASASYASIVADLTPERIAALDPKLHANAWVIRAYSQWRSGSYADAIDTAGIGLKTPGLGPRDRVLLVLLPALAIDGQVVDRWNAKGQKLAGADYPPFGRDFAEAYGELRKAEDAVDPSTAASTKSYLAYQHWRIVNDWSIVLGTVDPEQAGISAAHAAARAAAEKVVGGQLSADAKTARDAIPTDHPLRQEIKAQGGG